MSPPGTGAEVAPVRQTTSATRNEISGTFSELPSRNCRKAPKFDRENPEELLRYLEDVEICIRGAHISDIAEMKEVARRYADFSTANHWTTLKSYKDGTWEEYKAELISNYPEAANSTNGTFARLDKICKDNRNLDAREASQILAFARGFAYEANKLLEKRCSSSRELVRKVMECLSPGLARTLEDRLMSEKAKRPQRFIAEEGDRHPEDPFSLDEVLDLLRGIANDYSNIGSIFSYDRGVSGYSRGQSIVPEMGRYVKIEQYEALQQEIAALKDTTDLLKKENKMRALQSQPQSMSQSLAPPRFDNRQPQQVRIQSRQDNCFYCGGSGHMVRECDFAKDHLAKGKIKVDGTGKLMWNLIPREPSNLPPKDRVEQQSKVVNMYTTADDEFDRSLWEMQIAAPLEASNFMTSQGHDEARVWMERYKQAENEKAQWQKIVLQQQTQVKPAEPVIHQLLNAAPVPAPTPQAPNLATLQEQLDHLRAEMAKMGAPSGSGF